MALVFGNRMMVNMRIEATFRMERSTDMGCLFIQMACDSKESGKRGRMTASRLIIRKYRP